eukprot:4802103-Pleurochrysis_carterae.AAC.1
MIVKFCARRIRLLRTISLVQFSSGQHLMSSAIEQATTGQYQQTSIKLGVSGSATQNDADERRTFRRLFS